MQPGGGTSIGEWLADFYEYVMGSGQANISSINVNQSALDAGYNPADLAGVDASAAYAEACSRPGVPAEYKTAPPPPPHSSPEYVVRHIQTTQVTNIEQNFTNIDESRDINNILDIDGDVSGDLDFAPVSNSGEGVAAGEDARVAQVDIDASGGDATATGGTATGTGGTATSGDATSTNTSTGGAGTGGAGGAGTSSADGGAGGAGGAGGPAAPDLPFGTGGAGGAGGAGGTSAGTGGAGGAGTGGDGGDITSETESNADASGNADASADADGGDGGPVSLNIDFGDEVEDTEEEPSVSV